MLPNKSYISTKKTKTIFKMHTHLARNVLHRNLKCFSTFFLLYFFLSRSVLTMPNTLCDITQIGIDINFFQLKKEMLNYMITHDPLCRRVMGNLLIMTLRGQ